MSPHAYEGRKKAARSVVKQKMRPRLTQDRITLISSVDAGGYVSSSSTHKMRLPPKQLKFQDYQVKIDLQTIFSNHQVITNAIIALEKSQRAQVHASIQNPNTA
ncbi:hypothetical protein Trydic_g17676 [Trypoxylus dichotomus]